MIQWIKPHWKVGYYLIVLAILTVLVLSKWRVYSDGSPQTFDVILFLIWIAVLLAPLFKEVSFFGVSLKNEIDSLKNDLTRQIINLRSEIHNTVNNRTEINVFPLKDSEIVSFMQANRPVLELVKKQAQDKPKPNIEISDDYKYLIEVRYTLEKELRRIWGHWEAIGKELRIRNGQAIEDNERPQSFFQLARTLTQFGSITSQLASLLREVYRTCSPAVHGEEVSQTAITFVRDVAPGLIASLHAISPFLSHEDNINSRDSS